MARTARKYNEHRVSPRSRRRVKVRFGVGKADKTAFTKDLSETGAFLRTNAVFSPGKTVQVEVALPARTFSLWARVVWAKKVPHALAHVLECGMGLCFIDPPAEWFEHVRGWQAKVDPE